MLCAIENELTVEIKQGVFAHMLIKDTTFVTAIP